MIFQSVSSASVAGSGMPGTMATGTGEFGDISRSVSHTVLLARKLQRKKHTSDAAAQPRQPPREYNARGMSDSRRP